MAFDFPAAPTDGQVVTFPEGPAYTYNAASTAWDRSATTTTPPPLVRPVVTAVDPEVVGLNDGAQVIRVLGQNFTATSRILVDLVPQTTTFVSDTELTFTYTPPTWVVIVSVSVNTDGLNSLPVEFGVAYNPIINSITPASVPATGGPVTITANGSGFTSVAPATSILMLDGVDQVTTFVGTMGASFVFTPTGAGAHEVQARNGPVQAASAPVPLTVT